MLIRLYIELLISVTSMNENDSIWVSQSGSSGFPQGHEAHIKLEYLQNSCNFSLLTASFDC